MNLRWLGKKMSDELLEIVDIDQDGRGVAKNKDKTFFIHNALIGEKVEINVLKKKKNIYYAAAIKITNPSPDRTDPACEHYTQCGGCSMQHFSNNAQINFKHQAFFKTLEHIGKVKPEIVFEPVSLGFLNYRHKARLRAKFVEKKDKVLVGFNERLTHFLTDMDQCPILPERISKSIKPLKDLLKNLSIFNKIPQIEFASNQKRDIFIFRILDQLTKDDINKFEQFQSDFNIEVWVQEKGPETAKPLFHDQQEKNISYRLNEFNLNIVFDPTGFIQINPFINELMITKAIELLDLSSVDIVSDFFSGLGNFTLPIAKFANRVEGVEGSEQLVKLGEANAKLNGLNNIQFTFQNLFELDNQYLKRHKQSNKWLIDPPRDGAMQLIQLISPDISQPNKIVYISCNPATFARDANILVFEKGYKFKGSGILNMFPNTSHIESISVFEYGK